VAASGGVAGGVTNLDLELSGYFDDTGEDDTHTVTIDWGDGPPVSFDLIGTRSFHPADDLYGDLLRHHYTTLQPDGTVRVVVTVSDGDVEGTITRKLAFKPRGESVLKDYNDLAERIRREEDQLSSSNFFVVLQGFGSRLYRVTIDDSQRFLNAVQEFANNLANLEEKLTELFQGDLPRILDNLIADPVPFIRNLIAAAQKGFDDFFNPSNFATKIKDIAIGWLSLKAEAAGLSPFTVPQELTPDAVAGVVLKMLGLTWDDLIARAVQRIGADNVELVLQGYKFIEDRMGPTGPDGPQANFLQGLVGVLEGALTELLDNNGAAVQAQINALIGNALNPEAIATEAMGHAQTAIQAAIPGIIAKVATILIPGAGTFSRLAMAVDWLVQPSTINQVRNVVKVISNNADRLRTGGPEVVNEVAAQVTQALNGAAVVAFDLGMTLVGVGDLPKKILGAIGKVKDKIGAKIDLIIERVAGAAAKALDRVLLSVGGAVLYPGLIGRPERWVVSGSGERSRVWARPPGAGAPAGAAGMAVSLNGSVVDIESAVATWKGLLNNYQGAQRGELEALISAVEAAYWKGQQPAPNAPLDPTSLAGKVRAAVDAKNQVASLERPPQQGETAAQRDQRKRALAVAVLNLKAKSTAVVSALGTALQDGTLPSCTKKIQEWLAGKACFAAGTPMLVPGGVRLIEELRVGDLVLSRSEFDPAGPAEAKLIEEVFVRTAPVVDLEVEGRVVGTTAEHPFFAQGRGWIPAFELRTGDRVGTLTGEWVRVDAVRETGRVETVYNFRVADHHTYFVGTEDWGFSLWAHNEYLQFFHGPSRGNNDLAPSPLQVIQRAAWQLPQGIGNLPPDLTQAQVDEARARVLSVINYVRQRLPDEMMRSNTFALAEVVMPNGEHKFLLSRNGRVNAETPIPVPVRQLFAQAFREAGLTPTADDQRFFRVSNVSGTGANHAEQQILPELANPTNCLKGMRLLAIGATNQICIDNCQPAITAAGYNYAIAVPLEPAPGGAP
jgi:hypothetical protein